LPPPSIGRSSRAADAIDADEQAAAIGDEIERLQLLLIAERTATVAATAAAEEAAATINNLEAENKHLLLLSAAEKAATAAKVFAPGYGTPMTHDEHVQALQRQIHYLQEQLHAQAIPAQWQAGGAITQRQRPLTLRRPSGHPAVRYV
jgi:hypothetical protein